MQGVRRVSFRVTGGESPDLGALAAVLFLGMAVPGCAPPQFPSSAPSPLLGAPLPEIHRRSLDGHAIDASLVQGVPVLVKFFADYCQPCKETLPAAERIHEAYPDVTFLGVDEDDTSEAASDVVHRYGLSFPVIHDAGNVLAGRFRVTAMPTTFVADAHGVVRWVGAEGQTEAELRQAVLAARAAR
jgi:cytochrome c biogenesis protein CcmG, thiol:disulfide interchange protein DsbE